MNAKRDSSSINEIEVVSQNGITDAEVNNAKKTEDGGDWRSFAQDTTLHGLRVVASPEVSNFRRILWILLLLAALCYLITIAISLVLRVIHPQYVTDTSIEFDHFYGKRFPTVTICSYNQFRKSYLKKHPELVPALVEMFNVRKEDFSFLLGRDIPDDTPEVLNITEALSAAAHQLEDMVKKASFDTARNASAYFKPKFTDFGLCYIFNSEDNYPLLIKSQGPAGGLSLLLDVQEDEYYMGNYLNQGVGFKIMIHDVHDYQEAYVDGFGISPEKFTSISLTGSKTSLHPGSVGCVESNSPDFDNPLKHYSNYTLAACLNECFVDETIAKCGCRQYYDPGDAPVCLDTPSQECYYEVKNKMSTDQNVLSQDCDCDLQCEHTSYSLEISESRYPGEYLTTYKDNMYPRGMMANYTDEQFQKNIIKLDIFFKDLQLFSTSQIIDYTILDAGGDLGGYMGLMFGASLMTIIEMLEFFALSCRSQIKRVKSKKSRIIKVSALQ